jgi:hypothetical protein
MTDRDARAAPQADRTSRVREAPEDETGTLGDATQREPRTTRLEATPPPVAGAPGPADESSATLGLRDRSVAGEPGPADESNAALGIPPGAGEGQAESTE